MIEILLKEWIEQIKYYIHLIADYSIKESQVGAVLDDVLNLSGKMFRSKLLLLCAFLGSNWKNNKEKYLYKENMEKMRQYLQEIS